MTLGGFALAVGILVDNGTVVIENIERHVGLGEPLEKAILDGAGEVGLPTMLATLSISLVFVPVFLLTGTAKYLFSPLSLSVIISLVASLILSFTLVPLLFKYLMSSQVHADGGHASAHDEHPQAPRGGFNPFSLIHRSFEAGFNSLREGHRNTLSWMVDRPVPTVAFFAVLIGASLTLYPLLGMDFFPQIDAGQMRLHVRAPAGTRIEQTQNYFAQVEGAIRDIVGEDQIDVMLDNIGLPYSGINIALSDTATVGPMDGEILISLNEKHTPTPAHIADLRRELPKRFPQLYVLLPARRHRQSGAQFRAAGAYRHPHFRLQGRGGLRAGLKGRARHQRRAGRCRLPRIPGSGFACADGRCGPGSGARAGARPAVGCRQHAGHAQQQPAGGAEFLARSEKRRQLSARGAECRPTTSTRHRTYGRCP